MAQTGRHGSGGSFAHFNMEKASVAWSPQAQVIEEEYTMLSVNTSLRPSRPL